MTENEITKKQLKIIYDALLEKKAENIKIINISTISDVTDYFVLSSGNNDSQVDALSDFCLSSMNEAGFKERSFEGYKSHEWKLIDFGDIVVHIFNADSRIFYDLDRIWQDGTVEHL